MNNQVEDRVLMTIAMIYLIVVLFIFVRGVISYIFRGVGMYTLGKRRGMYNCAFAFIPFLRVYFQGQLCGPLQFKSKSIQNPGLWLMLLPFIRGMVMSVLYVALYGEMFRSIAAGLRATTRDGNHYIDPGEITMYTENFLGEFMVRFLVIIVIVALVILVLNIMKNVLEVLVNQRIYATFTTHEYSILHAVIGMFIPFYTSVYFFIIRKKAPIGQIQ